MVSCLLAAGCGDDDAAARTAPANPTVAVTCSEPVWIEARRATPRTTNYAGAPERTLRVVIWQPEQSGAAPLFVMAHGWGGLPEKFDAFARTVAGAGYVVAAPAFPLTN